MIIGIKEQLKSGNTQKMDGAKSEDDLKQENVETKENFKTKRLKKVKVLTYEHGKPVIER